VTQRKNRVGVMINGPTAARWEADVLREIQASDHSELAVFIENQDRTFVRSPWEKIRTLDVPWNRVLFSVFQRLDRRLFRAGPDANETVDISDLVERVGRIPVVPIRKRFVHRFRDEDVAAIRERDLDVILRFGFNILKGDVLDAARYGIWSYHHDDNREYRGGPPLFWEIYERNPFSGSVLQVLTEKLDGGRVIYRSRSGTELRSLERNRNPVYWKTSRFAIRRLADLHREGWEFIEAHRDPGQGAPYERGIFRTPGNLRTAGFLVRHAAYLARFAARRRFTTETWFLAYRTVGEGAPPGLAAGPSGDYRLLLPPPGRFYADPAVFSHQGRTALLFEDFDFAAGKACISAAELDEAGRAGAVRPVLERPYHLSYPFVFAWNDAVYMIPETAANRRVELYRCVRFPDAWELDTVLLEGRHAVDATLHHDGARWWMFLNVADPDGASSLDELCLFHAPEPRGPWTPHPRNPVVSDVQGSRPAGGLFRDQGRLIRPGQDSSRRYGYAVVLHHVQELTPTAYREVPVARIDPDWLPGNLGSHTLNRHGSVEVLDARCLRSRVPGLQTGAWRRAERAWRRTQERGGGGR